MEGKWIFYDHYFESHSKTKAAEPTLYAHIRLRAVCKETTGRTVLPENVIEACPDIRSWVMKDKAQ